MTTVEFGSRRQMIAYLWQHLTFLDLLLLILYFLLCQLYRAKGILAAAISRGGLTGVYCSMVSSHGNQIAQVLKAVAVNSKHSAVMIHCSLGKDRTGVITALILMIVGVNLNDIVADYEATAKAVPLRIRKSLLPNGLLDKNVFARADGQAIRDMDQFVRDKYGSLDHYLDQIGFDRNHRQLLRKHLLKKKTQ